MLAFDTTPEQVGLVAAGARLAIYELVAEQLDLEDVFLELTSTQDAREQRC